MKTYFECEICGTRSHDVKLIEQCEAKGHPDLSLLPPLGLIVGDSCGPGVENSGNSKSPHCGRDPHPCGSHLCGAGFIWVVQWAGVNPHDLHGHDVAFGVFRGNGCGDTFKFRNASSGYDAHVMGVSKYDPEQVFHRWQDWPEAQPCPAFWRAVKAVREAGWVARVVRNGELVDFRDPLPAEAS